MAARCSSETSVTPEGPPPAPAHLTSTIKRPKRRFMKSHPEMELALAAVNDGMSIRMAAAIYDIPHKTLGNKFNGKHQKKVGRPNTFTLEEEAEIREILVRCSKIGVPLGKRSLIKIVKPSPLRKFLRRNREVSLRILSALSFKKSREWTAARCQEWISLLQNLSDEGFLDNPSGIWNLDESGFRLAELYDRIYAERGVNEAVVT
ncbi:hypothetical protein RvY_14097 [Ramazzottius varieornatus]|uniref:HTH psq-type domain-containing protein n=1 Tax=Ramazzottius varieornatus TaxID=947166 RepID=A0A1D1VV89_RAMVA|nr:hypothetical protein RvY_14097 [Ramazzottius varieornatus]